MTIHSRTAVGRWPRLKTGVMAAAVALICLAPALPAAAIVVDTVSYPQDVSLVLSGVPVTLTILAGSASADLVINPTNFVPTIGTGPLKVRYTGPTPMRFVDDLANTYCNYVSGNNDFSFTSAHSGRTISISATPCAAPVSGGGGGSGGYSTPVINMSAPNGGQTLAPGSIYTISWAAAGTLSGIKISLSTDAGLTYPTVIAASAANSGFYDWTIPDVAATQARIKVEAVDGSGLSLASDFSEANFTITGTTPPPAEEPAGETPSEEPGSTDTPTTPEAIAAAEAAAPASDGNATGGFSPSGALANTPTINVDKDLDPPPADRPAQCVSGSLIKASTPAVYFCGKDGKRYVFVNEGAFYSWFKDFSTVITLTDAALAQIPLGGNITYKPGSRMVKINTDPKVYAVARGGLLRWVTTEAVAVKLYGADWNRKIDDVPDSFFFSYRIGDPITAADVGL